MGGDQLTPQLGIALDPPTWFHKSIKNSFASDACLNITYNVLCVTCLLKYYIQLFVYIGFYKVCIIYLDSSNREQFPVLIITVNISPKFSRIDLHHVGFQRWGGGPGFKSICLSRDSRKDAEI